VTKAKLFTATFNRVMENIKEINVAEIFVAAVDDIDPEAMFDLRGEISPWYSATGQSPTSTDPANWKAPKTTAPATSAPESTLRTSAPRELRSRCRSAFQVGCPEIF